MIKCLFNLTLAGSGVLLLWLIQRTFLHKLFSARWQYRFLKVALIFFLIPIGLISESIPAPATDNSYITAPPVSDTSVTPSDGAVSGVPITDNNSVSDLAEGSPSEREPVGIESSGSERPASFAVPANALPILLAVWLAGALTVGIWEICKYRRFRKNVLSPCREDLSEDSADILTSCMKNAGLKRRPSLKLSPNTCPPFVTGLFCPVIVLPDETLSGSELSYALLHETLHIKKRDLWVRALALIVKILHWYNPMAWLLNRLIVEWSELACDEALAAPLNSSECQAYGHVILKSAAFQTKGIEQWAAGLSPFKSMKRRLSHMLKIKKMSKGAKIAASVTLALILVIGAVLAIIIHLPVGAANEKEPDSQIIQGSDTTDNHADTMPDTSEESTEDTDPVTDTAPPDSDVNDAETTPNEETENDTTETAPPDTTDHAGTSGTTAADTEPEEIVEEFYIDFGGSGGVKDSEDEGPSRPISLAFTFSEMYELSTTEWPFGGGVKYVDSASELPWQLADQYGEEYFRNKALLLVYDATSSISTSPYVDAVTLDKQSRTVTVDIDYHRPGPGGMYFWQIGYWLVCYEVNSGYSEYEWTINHLNWD